MSQKTITVGTAGTPADLDTNFSNAQDNFTELYAGKANALTSDQNYVTDAQLVVIGNTSGTNSGDQSLAGLVAKTGNETIAGVKTFTSSPVVPAPTTDMQAATKKYVDDSITAGGGYTDEQAQDTVGAMVTGNTETGISVTYDDATGKLNFAVDPVSLDAIPVNGHTTVSVSSDGIFDALAGKQSLLTDPLVQADVDDTPVNGATTVPVSSNWAYDHAAAADPHPGYMLESALDAAVAANSAVAANTAKVSFDSTSSAKLAGIAAGAEVNVQSDWNAGSGDAQILNKPTIPTAASLSVDDLITLSGVAIGAVNLGTFTGSTIADNSTIKVALQALETAVGSASGLTSLPTSDNQILQATGVGTYEWSSDIEGLINDAGTTTADVLSAAEVDIRIAAGGGLANPMTTAGDMIKGGTAGAAARMIPGTGVVTALETNVGSAGAPVVNGGALGTPSSGTLTNCTFPTLNQNTTGSAATLTTARTIGGVSFNGSANINLPGVNAAGDQNTSGNAATVTNATLTTALTVNTGPVTLVGNAGGASQITIPNGTCNLTSGTSAITVASGTAALGTSAIANNGKASTVTVSATGVASTDVLDWGFNSDPTGVTGYNPAGDLLYVVAFPTTNNVNFIVCNKSGASITPGAITLNWKVRR